MSNLFNEFLYKPLSGVLVFLSGYLGDLGFAIIVLTIFIRIILFPLFYKSAKDMTLLQSLAPKIKEIQTRHKDNHEEQAKNLMNLYREHKVNPFSGFLLLLIQLPILFALYKVFMSEFSVGAGFLNHNFLGLIDLSKSNIIIVCLAAAAQYFQGKISVIKNNKPLNELTPIERMGRQMIYFGPIMTIMFLYFLPSAIGLYWLTTSLFSVVQQIIINKKIYGQNT